MLPNHLCNYGSGPYKEHFDETVYNIYNEFGTVVQEENLFKGISYVELWFNRSEPFVQFWLSTS